MNRTLPVLRRRAVEPTCARPSPRAGRAQVGWSARLSTRIHDLLAGGSRSAVLGASDRRACAAALVLSVLALTTAVGCSTAAEVACDEHCKCEVCNDREYDECVIEVEAAFDIADVYDCGLEAEDLYQCAIDRGYCQDGDWRYHDVCAIEDDAVDWCVSRSSLLRGHYPNPEPG